MDMRKCDVCGEYYSSTYRRCPFCEEEEAERRGKPVRRRAGDFRNKRGGNAVGVILLLLFFVVAGLAVGHFFGDTISDMIGIRTPLPPEDDTTLSNVDGDPSNAGDGVDDPGPAGDPDTNSPEDPGPVDTRPSTAVLLSSADFTLEKTGATHTLTASGGSGTYTWTTADAAIATVGEDGTVTAKGAGNTEITVSDGYTSAVCTVRVKAPETPVTSTGTVKLNRSDMTMPAGTTFQLKVSGTSSAVTWSVADTSIATVDGDGTVHFIKKGTTTATATVDGKTLQCIVRVK